MSTLLTILIVLVSLLVTLLKKCTRPTNFPPGPKGLPLFGYVFLLFTKESIHKALQNLAKKYGPVTGFYVGPNQPFISVVGLEAVKEVLQNEDLNGRPSGAVIQSGSYGEKLGLLFVDGSTWQEQRRFTLRHLRDLGFGKTSIENQMMDEVQDVIRDIKEASKSVQNNIVDLTGIFNVSVINILWAIVGGKRFERDDPIFRNLVLNVDLFIQSTNFAGATFPFPAFFVRRFPSILKVLGFNIQLIHPLQKFIEESIEEHQLRRRLSDAHRDFLDVYLEEMEEKNKNTNRASSFNKKQLVVTIQDLFAAGSDTSSKTIGFAILYMIHFPQIQSTMQAELDDVCGEGLPSLVHRPNLPYTEAVLMEVLRFSSIAPLTIPHYAVQETQVKGFTIPKGSIIAVNLDSVFKDEQRWKNPGIFQPERHLNQDGTVIKNEALIPFGLGKRACIGEPLARNTIFLFVTALVKTFDFKPVPGEALPSLEPIPGLTLGPQPYRTVVTVRGSR